MDSMVGVWAGVATCDRALDMDAIKLAKAGSVSRSHAPVSKRAASPALAGLRLYLHTYIPHLYYLPFAPDLNLIVKDHRICPDSSSWFHHGSALE